MTPPALEELARPEIKMIDPCALASLTTGIVLCEAGFSPVSAAAEWVLGHPVWTHEFIVPEIQSAMIAAVLEQYPTIPVEQPADWRTLVADLRAEFGDEVPVRRGTGTRDRDPVETALALRSRATLAREVGDRELR